MRPTVYTSNDTVKWNTMHCTSDIRNERIVVIYSLPPHTHGDRVPLVTVENTEIRAVCWPSLIIDEVREIGFSPQQRISMDMVSCFV